MVRSEQRKIIYPEIERDHTFTGVLDCERRNGYVLGIFFFWEKLAGTSHRFFRSSIRLEQVEKSEVDSSQSKVSNVYFRQQQPQDMTPTYNKLDLKLSGLN